MLMFLVALFRHGKQPLLTGNMPRTPQPLIIAPPLTTTLTRSRAPPVGAQAPASGGARGDHRHSRNINSNTSGSGSGSSGEAEPRGILGFLRSIFGRQPASTAAGVMAGASAAAATAGEETDHASGERASTEEARAAASAAVAGEEEERRSAAGARVGAGAGAGVVGGVAAGTAGGAAVNVPAPVDAGDGAASFAIRDLLSFLQPAFGGPDPAGSIASLEQALTWPMAGIGMIGAGPGGAAGAAMVRRRLQRPTADQARQELQFNGLLLAPHQVCTHTSVGRKEARKEAGMMGNWVVGLGAWRGGLSRVACRRPPAPPSAQKCTRSQ